MTEYNFFHIPPNGAYTVMKAIALFYMEEVTLWQKTMLSVLLAI